VVVSEGFATVHTGRLGSGTVQRIRSDQDGSSMVACLLIGNAQQPKGAWVSG